MPSCRFDVGLLPRDAYTLVAYTALLIVPGTRSASPSPTGRSSSPRCECASRAPDTTRIDRHETDLAVGVRRLDAAQICLRRLRAVLGIVPRCIALPDLDVGVRVARLTLMTRWSVASGTPCRFSRMSLRKMSDFDGYGPSVSFGDTAHASLLDDVQRPRRACGRCHVDATARFAPRMRITSR
jgi:hypothetical protein